MSSDEKDRKEFDVAGKPRGRNGTVDVAAELSRFQSIATGYSHPSDGRGTGGHGDRIRDVKRGKSGFRDPRSVFLIYIGFDTQHRLIVRQVKGPLSGGLVATEQRLFTRAKTPTAPYETNFQNMVWDEPCYITMIVDQPQQNPPVDRWNFYWGDDPDHNPIRFHRRKDVRPGGTKVYTENYSFYDAEKPFTFTDTQGQKYNAFRCINYIRDQFDNLGEDRELDYCFEIYLQAPLATGGYITMLIDPDGQNQGPRD